MTKAIFAKRGNTLVAIEPQAIELLSGYAEGSNQVVEVKKIRGEHGQYQLRKWWALCGILAANIPVFDADKRGVSDMLLIACRQCDWRIDPITNGATPIPRSLAIEAMEEDVFDRLWQRAVYYVNERWLPIGTAKLQAEIDDFFAGPDERARRTSLGKRLVPERADA